MARDGASSAPSSSPSVVRPSSSQRRWLRRGLDQAGGKLPLFDDGGQRVNERTVRSCIGNGWAEPWFANPLKPDWLVCRLTPAGRETVAGPEEEAPPDDAVASSNPVESP